MPAPASERMKRIVTHRAPDPDAIVAAWLAAEHLFPGNLVVVLFKGRTQAVHTPGLADCVVDVGNRYDPKKLWFDHKPPAFGDRNATCATKLLWEHLLALGRDVRYLEPIVQVVFEGDTRKSSPALRQSRRDGLHAAFGRAKRQAASDDRLYELMAGWLERATSPNEAAVIGQAEPEQG
jgi:hypothetical protein